jgi:putative chitinase
MTEDEIARIDVGSMWSRTVSNDLKEGFKRFAPFAKVCGIENEADMADFIGQMRQETGSKFKLTENMNYSERGLIATFGAFRRDRAKANKYGRGHGHRANQEMIANIAYGGRMGNNHTGDGWAYRGGGAGHLTGRANYRAQDVWLKANTDLDVSFEDNPELVRTAEYAMLSFGIFWSLNKIYRKTGHHDIHASFNVTRIINRHTKSYDARWEFTQQAYKLIK